MKRKCTNSKCSNYHKQLHESQAICPVCATPTDICPITKLARINDSFSSFLNRLQRIYDYISQLPLIFLCLISPILGCILVCVTLIISVIISVAYIVGCICEFFQNFYELLSRRWRQIILTTISLILPLIFLILDSDILYLNIPNKSTMPLSRDLPNEFYSSPKLSQTIEQQIKEQLPGELLINLPHEMTVGVQERAEVRIAKQRIKDLKKGLRGRGIPEIEKIKISPIMKVRLIGDKFDIQALSHEQQPIIDWEVTQWEWNITPREVGNQSLAVSVSLRIEIPQLDEPIVKDYPVYEKKIRVKVSFEPINIITIISVLILLILGIINKRSIFNAWRKRKKLNKIPAKPDKFKSSVLKSAIIRLENGNLEIGFPCITVQIWAESEKRPTQYRGALPPNPGILQLYNEWQLMYEANQGIKRKLVEKPAPKIIFSRPEFDDLTKKLEENLNKWLISEQFSPIDRTLHKKFDISDRLQVIIESQNPDVRKLPWHLWDFINSYRKAEIALSSPFYDRPLKSAVTRDRIRILSILGDDKGINLNKDQELLTQLDAETSFLVKRNRQELDQQLWCEQGWDILCFSGHSSSEIDGSTGYIYINDTDKLSIPELKNALSKAIERGLQIAIFNSCDGLGLANQLAQLHIPQIIVFREPVPDVVAQEFLKNFLTAFASGKSFYLAVREARERLQSLENDFPCASWLPVICQNPAEVPPTWRSLQNP